MSVSFLPERPVIHQALHKNTVLHQHPALIDRLANAFQGERWIPEPLPSPLHREKPDLESTRFRIWQIVEQKPASSELCFTYPFQKLSRVLGPPDEVVDLAKIAYQILSDLKN